MCRKMSASGSSALSSSSWAQIALAFWSLHLGAEEDDALAEQPLVDVVVEDGDPGAAAGRRAARKSEQSRC